jgi:hypothetical protein
MPVTIDTQVIGASESQIKNALSAAKDFTAAKDRRRRESELRDAVLRENPQLLANKSALQTLLVSHLTKTGFDIEGFERIRAAQQAELGRLAADRKTQAMARSTALKGELQLTIDQRLKAFESLGAAAGASVSYELLNTPFLIWPTLGVFFDSSQIVPSNSWAKMKVDSTRSSGYEEMSFYFLYQNPNNRAAVVNIDAYLVLKGHCQCGSDGGVFPGSRYSNLQLLSKLYLLEWWNQPPTQPLGQADQFQQALFISTDTGGWSDPGAIEFKDIFRGYDLRYTSFIVPPNGVVLFEVAAAVSYSMSDGVIAVDFASGDFEIVCPAVLVATLS